MAWRVSKDGTEFFEIDADFDEESGVDRSLEAAKAKGYKPYFQMTKDGKQVFDVEATEDSLKAAYSKGYDTVDAFKFRPKTNKADSALKGTVRGLSQGFVDELAGGFEAAGSAVGLRGLGGESLSDIRLETDREDQQSLGDVYRGARDAKRQSYAKAEADNPGLFNTADVMGSVAGGLAVPLANTAKAATATGALQGLGRSEADLTQVEPMNYLQAGVDTLVGAGAGLAGYGLAKGVEKAVEVAPRMAKETLSYTKALTRGMKKGGKEAGEDVPGLVKPLAEVVGGLKGAVKELRELTAVGREFKEVAAQAREALNGSGGPTIKRLQDLKVTAIGNGKQLSDLTDEEAVLGALLADGDNQVKQWFAKKASFLQPGQVDASEYANLLGMGTATRRTARDFDRRAAAAELKPTVQRVQDLFKGARNSRYDQLQSAAREAFDPAQGDVVLREVDEAIADADVLKSVPGSVRSVLDDVKGMLVQGKGVKEQKLTPGSWAEAQPAEKFHRLQKARELMDDQINWAKREGHSQAERLLRGVRQNIDEVLKTSPDKVEADALYRASKQLEGRFFGAAEFRDPSGAIDVDEGKLARLLGDTDQAVRFRGALDELKEFAKREDLPESFRTEAAQLVTDLERKIGVAGQQRAINSFRYSQGPSSPAIERLGSVSQGSTLVQDAVRAPAGFLNQADEFARYLQQKTGKSYGELSNEQRQASVRFWTWLKKNPDASETTVEQTFSRLFGR